MQLTHYHSKYLAYELTKRCASDSVEKLAGALVDAQVDLNPHQVEAALFAFRSPFSKGALLADEVGLGKTIEAGLVISQKWAERKRRILIITPANLRKQWHQELQEKFFLPCQILEGKSYNDSMKQGNFSPFEIKDTITICSYQFARSKASDIQRTPWDLVVADEAHRLRNVYKPGNIIANTLKMALKDSNKLLLTATPLQNSLLELFGLVSFIDEHAFGDLKSFREQFASLNNDSVFETLKARLSPICHRTLRRQVTAYVPYTKRQPIVQSFTPEESEDKLYQLVSDYLRRENLLALPKGQRSLITLVLRKLLSSSTFAIAGALNTMSDRLREQVKPSQPSMIQLEDELTKDFEGLSETAEEWPEDTTEEKPLSEAERNAIKQEIAELDSFRDLALSVSENAKGKALLTALTRAFEDVKRLGAAQKAIIFTESRKTQEYIERILSETPFANHIVLFNGSNNDEKSRRIYSEWLQCHKDTDRITGSKTADMRSALVDYFREKGQIMIATEAGAEGINLQFCSLVVNYDLPWNPQRIEQRIGRCHRYGQKHDVVVVNFLNQKNEADTRVFQLLSEKFSLFEGVFGASDEVLGAIESGVDFERRIADIYQKCRTSEEIKASFDQLQLELFPQINAEMTKTRKQLLENFDQEVHEKLRISLENTKDYLNRYEQSLMDLTKHELGDHAEFIEGQSAFLLKSLPFLRTSDIPLGRYELPRRTGEAHFYRLGHPLAVQVINKAKTRELPQVEITFNYSQNPLKISVLAPFVGQQGDLIMRVLSIESLDQAEDHFLIAATTDSGQVLNKDIASKFFMIPATNIVSSSSNMANQSLEDVLNQQKEEARKNVSERNAHFVEEEAEKLDAWADDLKVALEREIKDLDRQIKESKRAAKVAPSLEEKLAGLKQVTALTALLHQKRRTLFDAQDEIEQKRDALIAEIEGKLNQKENLEEVFVIRWRLL